MSLDLSIVARNWRGLSEYCGENVECGAVVKADAYGMGMAQVSRALLAAGATKFFVANIKEGTALRSIVGKHPQIFVLAGYSPDFRELFKQAAVIPCISDTWTLKSYIDTFPEGDYAVHVETGLNRLALDATVAANELASMRARSPVLIMSHLACADDAAAPLNEYQLERLKNCALVKMFPSAPLSLSGSEGIFLGSHFELDCVRPGIGLYCGGFEGTTRDCLKVRAELISVKDIPAGAGVGYVQAWVAPQNTKIAALSMGYADGLPRVSGGFCFFADGVECAVRGRVSMDIVNVDVSHLKTVPASFELIGEHQSLSTLSKSFGEIPNSILTRFGACMGPNLC